MSTKIAFVLAVSFAMVGCASSPTTSPKLVVGRSAAPSARDAAPVDVASAAMSAPSAGLPPGWLAPAALAPIAGPRAGSFKARIAELAREQRVEPVAIDVARIPVTEVEPAPTLPNQVAELPALPTATEVLTVGGRAVVRGNRSGKIVIDWDERSFFPWGEGGASPHTSHGVKHIHYLTLASLPGGQGEVEEMDGYYDIDTHRAVAVRRMKAKAVAVADGLAYVYRTTCERCDTGRERLYVITPASGWETPFSRASFDLAAERGGSFVEDISPDAIATWRRIGGSSPFRRHVRLGLEVTRSAADAAPVAFAYAAEVTR